MGRSHQRRGRAPVPVDRADAQDQDRMPQAMKHPLRDLFGPLGRVIRFWWRGDYPKVLPE